MAQEIRDKGVAEQSAPETGMMGMLRNTFGQVKDRMVGSPRASTPTSDGVSAAQQESGKVTDVKDEGAQVGEVPQEPSPPEQQLDDPVRKDSQVGADPEELSRPEQQLDDPVRKDSQVGADPQELSRPEQQLDDPVRKDSQVGADPQELSQPEQQRGDVQEESVENRGRDFSEDGGVGTSPTAQPTGSSGSVEEAGASPAAAAAAVASSPQDGTSASTQIPREDLKERSAHDTNSKSVENPTPQATNPYTEGDPSGVPSGPSVQPSEPTSPGLFGKLKNMVTGQKPTQGTATKNATTGTTGTPGEEQPAIHGYIQSPTTDKSGDILDKAKEKLGHKGRDAGTDEAWPAPTKPDMGNVDGATRTNAEGQPIEGPTQPASEDTKKEGLMTKLMDKLHLHEKSPSP